MGRGMTECGGILAEYGNVLEWRRKSEAFVLEKMARGMLCYVVVISIYYFLGAFLSQRIGWGCISVGIFPTKRLKDTFLIFIFYFWVKTTVGIFPHTKRIKQQKMGFL